MASFSWLLGVALILAAEGLVYCASDNGKILAKPAVVPFMGEEGNILVYVGGNFSHWPRIVILDERGVTLQRGGSTGAHVDRHGHQWLHIPLDLGPLPYGASSVRVLLEEAGAWELKVKVVRAVRKSDAVLVDNVKGCMVGRNGLPFFPFGSYIYGVTTAAERAVPETEVKYGMNWVAPYLSEAAGHSSDTWNTILQFLDRCHQIGVRVHYDLHQLATLPDTATKWQLLQTEVKMVMDHPAVIAYYLADEPGGQHIDPKLLEKAYDFVKSMDPYKPITMVFCCVDPSEYISGFDIGMADPYPIPNSPPESVILKTAMLAKTGKPFFIVPQAFGGGELWERTPTPAEERVMTYASVLTGAVGIQYFVRSPGVFPYAPTAWSECRRLALEIGELSSAVLSGHPHVAVTPSVTSGVLAVGWGERVEGEYVVAAVNYLKKPVNVTLTANVSYSGAASVVFEDRTLMVEDGSINDIISAYGTVVYRFPPISTSKVSPSNVLVNPSFEQVTSAGSVDGAYLSVPSDPASTYLADSSMSVDGLHSLRLVTPTPHNGYQVGPYPTSIKAGVTYDFSFWAISNAPNLTLQFTFTDLTPAAVSFQTDTKWSKFNTTLKSQSTEVTSVVHYGLVDNGTAWLDLMQLIPQT